jgi:hypothetical protein
MAMDSLPPEVPAIVEQVRALKTQGTFQAFKGLTVAPESLPSSEVLYIQRPPHKSFEAVMKHVEVQKVNAKGSLTTEQIGSIINKILNFIRR